MEALYWPLFRVKLGDKIFHSCIMPTKGQKQQLAAARAKGQESLVEKQAALSSETAADDLWDRLQAANSRVAELEQLLAKKDMECQMLQSELDKSNKTLEKHVDDSALWKAKHKETYHELRMQRQTAKRGKDKVM